MADKKEEAKADGAKPEDGAGKSGLVKILAMVGGVVILPCVLVGVLYVFVLAPRLHPADDAHAAEAAKAEEEAHAEEGGEMAGAGAIEFEDESVNIMPDAPGGKAALLNYKCAIVVNSAELVEQLGDKTKKPFFSSILLKLHSNRTKAELNDPRVKESILRQAKQECNSLLKRLLPEDKEAQIVQVLHVKYTIFEL